VAERAFTGVNRVDDSGIHGDRTDAESLAIIHAIGFYAALGTMVRLDRLSRQQRAIESNAISNIIG
jgi:hypothetical protein